jgi:hypothetical protein
MRATWKWYMMCTAAHIAHGSTLRLTLVLSARPDAAHIDAQYSAITRGTAALLVRHNMS